MKITFEIPVELEARLRERAAASDTESMRQILVDSLFPAVMKKLFEWTPPSKNPAELTLEEYDAICAELDSLPAPEHSPNISFTREEIYEDHL